MGDIRQLPVMMQPTVVLPRGPLANALYEELITDNYGKWTRFGKNALAELCNRAEALVAERDDLVDRVRLREGSYQAMAAQRARRAPQWETSTARPVIDSPPL